jgi:hypothetical protein
MKSSGLLWLISDNALSGTVMTYYSSQSNFKQQEEIRLTRMNAYFNMVAKVFDTAVF